MKEQRVPGVQLDEHPFHALEDVCDAIRVGSRLVAAHIKDIAPKGELADEDGWADVGHGTVNWEPIVAALKAAGTEIFVMEHDNPRNDERFARRSIETARAF